MDIKLTAEQKKIQPQLESANINPSSFLATDYLNHYNEIVMLLEMVPDMPDMAEETYEWQPKSYPQHFLDSGFMAKDLAVEAYEKAPAIIRDTFDTICRGLDTFLVATISGLKTLNVSERGLNDQAQHLIRSRVASVQEELGKLNAVIHGKLDGLAEEPEPITETGDQEAAHTQAEIDALFD